MEKYHGYTLDYWKNNAEEDYIKTPISVLEYITCLEEHIEQLTIPAVVGRSEQLPCRQCGGNGGGVTDNGWEQCDCQKVARQLPTTNGCMKRNLTTNFELTTEL